MIVGVNFIYIDVNVVYYIFNCVIFIDKGNFRFVIIINIYNCVVCVIK